MRPPSRHIDHDHEEINKPIDEVVRNLSDARDLVDRFLECVRARPPRSLLRAEHIEFFTVALSSLAALACGLGPSIRFCHDAGSEDDPHRLVVTTEDLISRLDSLLGLSRRLAIKVVTTDEELARRLNEAAAGLSESIGSIIGIIKCHRSTRAMAAERDAEAFFGPTHARPVFSKNQAKAGRTRPECPIIDRRRNRGPSLIPESGTPMPRILRHGHAT
jgi:hypothetical protein